MDERVKAYLDKVKRFSEDGELYQNLPCMSTEVNREIKTTRDMQSRWDAYGILGLEDKTILDIGCNIGGFSFFCAPHCKSYLGIDIDADSIELAKYLYKQPNCAFEVQAFKDICGVSFDVIFAFAVWYYTHMKLPIYAAKIASLLNPGGVLYYESHGRGQVEKERGAFESLFIITRVITVPTVSNCRRNDYRYFAEMRKRG